MAMRLVMTFRVRDEADALEENLRFHRAQGVDRFIALEDGAAEPVGEILDRWSAAGLLERISRPPGEAPRRRAEWITEMARRAATHHDADWVINNDADEFWWPLRGTLRDAFASLPDRYAALSAPRTEFVPRPGEEPWPERLIYRERLSSTLPKRAHRAHPQVAATPYAVRIPGAGPPAHRGRAWLRTAAERQEPSGAPIPALTWPIRVLHFPVRSAEQFRTRVERAYEAGRHSAVARARELYAALDAGTLARRYAEATYDDGAIEAGLASGELARDTRLRDFLRRCPGPDEPVPADALAGLGPEPGEEEELADDGLAALLRAEQLAEGRLRTARRRLRRLERELERLRSSDDENLRRRVARRLRARRDTR
ncbi:MAG TPA: glycosyltransferase family 2 protein [Solirubrobacterales bacterium]|jgi:hypothetical protein